MNLPPYWRGSLLAAGLAAGLVSCLPTTEPQPRTSVAGSALDALRAQYGAPTQVFTYNSARVDVFRTASGGTLATGSNAFLSIGTGSLVPGLLSLRVREVLSKADMVLSGLPSMGSQGEALESGGQFLVQASTADNQLLRLSPRVKLGLATPVPAGLASRFGTLLYAPDYPGNLHFRWAPTLDTASSVQASQPLVTGDPLYFRSLIASPLYNSNNGWLSIARPLFTGYPGATVRVHLSPPDADAANAAVYLVFRDYNAVVQLAATGQGNFELANVPGQAAITVVALYAAASKLYLGQHADTVRAGQLFQVPLAERSVADVAAEIKHLP